MEESGGFDGSGGFDDSDGADGSGEFDGFEGYAAASDPRESYDDLLLESTVDSYDATTYGQRREMEAFRSGWVAVGVVLDDADRVLLVHEAADDLWFVPGGTLQAEESLREGLVREVAEESGVVVDPVRPRAIKEWVARNEEQPEEWTGFRVAIYEARAERTTIGDDLGVDDEAITDADWFETLPEDVYDRELASRVLERARAD